ncbi:hypothetical protein EI427_08860 [Flammeovirga pectinis]|uniref:Cyclic nucleotide-binding domain-containing protein n=1 Tax=Flammeovirga pectinis TaxID=2494373 RepID=A0A3Q9FMW8_9BACT|nr:hypothetical protein [Flammeovirga pectinis]AZQ62345.1 hypothetical protein EI427_08860 [Flammeovirga pectinis]
MRRLIHIILPFILFISCSSNNEINWASPTSLDQDFMNRINDHREEINLTELKFNPIFFEQAKRFASELADNPGLREQISKDDQIINRYTSVIKAQTGANARGCTGFSASSNLDPNEVVKIMTQTCRSTIDDRNANAIGGAVFQNSNNGDYFYVTFIGKVD